MDDDEWQVPAPMEDPESRGFRPVRDDKGAIRLVPTDDAAEDGQDGGKGAPTCPFS
ncbi:MAG: hypothetical protein ABWX67_08815 [Allosphingosinicella sp.]